MDEQYHEKKNEKKIHSIWNHESQFHLLPPCHYKNQEAVTYDPYFQPHRMDMTLGAVN